MRKYIRWAGGGVARKFGDEHFLVVGASGSGKSTLINHSLHSVLSDPSARGLVYDPKQELIPFLYGIRGFEGEGQSVSSSIKNLHPFDQRSCAWDMAADIDDPISARQLATILVPSEDQEGANTFFTNAVRDLLSSVILAFVECVPTARAWTFRDVLLAMFYPAYMDVICSFDVTRSGKPFPLLRRVRHIYLGSDADEKTRANILASINSKLAIFEPVAAAWAKAGGPLGGRISLREWVEGDEKAVLVLGNDEAARAAIDPINRAIFKRAVELVLARKERTQAERESGDNQIWFFLDEVREAGKLDGLGRLLTKGRSKNACVMMGIQDLDGLKEVYGAEVANELCSQFNNIAVLRVNSPDTAKWATDLFGRRLEVARNSSVGLSSGSESGLTMNQGKSEEERPFIYSESFLYGPNAAAAKGVYGYRKGPDQQVNEMSRQDIVTRLRFSETTEVTRMPKTELSRLLGEAMRQSGDQVAHLAGEFLPRSSGDQYLELWSADDWSRLGIQGNPPAPFGVAPSSDAKESAKRTKTPLQFLNDRLKASDL
jgi:type IV secretory pathway TraG/TraD family ATPase VirD4